MEWNECHMNFYFNQIDGCKWKRNWKFKFYKAERECFSCHDKLNRWLSHARCICTYLQCISVHRIEIENDVVIEFSFRYIKHCFLFDWLIGWMSESNWSRTGTDSDSRLVIGNHRNCLIRWKDNGHEIMHYQVVMLQDGKC